MRALWKSLFILCVFKAVVHAEDSQDGDDGDGSSAEEVLKAMDLNEDRKISIGELLQYMFGNEDERQIAVATSIFQQSDKDGDNMIGEDELPDMMKKFMETDEEVSNEEM
mmetsp:Transcript_6206/g.17496  ORF Transcript_6206/g.17496 Transcript_6206/m.17496 type:complete len:110 (-) Transcript_6206:55-384(-)|eukprot:CAMPEP_0179245034 /NCGR_PEP_ID=MMETSP0797-20121207/18363_1 /TAXON_ID=47934 /ORGANISM="Dinophysis acuminata, Strain DAEP01" /LENGTH=109 /DNA_ID=CAMNT_0020952565 /DNA_START=70 /DNA_END=399 /DNA_ORIENTATION=-